MRCPNLSDLPSPPLGKTGWPWDTGTGGSDGGLPVEGTLPRISVVTPSYNQAPFLEETIRSVLLQNYPDLEYFVIDGGSTDESVAIIRKYERWLAGWISERDRGQSDAINKGWRKASGKLWAWVNSDDVYLPGTLLAVAAELKNGGEPSLIYGDHLLVDGRGDILREVHSAPTDTIGLLKLNWVGQGAAFVGSRAMSKTELLDESLHYCMDYDLWLRLSTHGELKHIARKLSAFRLHDSSKSCSQSARMMKEIVEVAERFLSLEEQVPSEFRDHPETLLSGSYLDAGLALWFSAERDEGLSFLRKVPRSDWLDAETVPMKVAQHAFQRCGAGAEASIAALIALIPELDLSRDMILAWTSALRVNSAEMSGLARWKGIARSVWHGPRPEVLRAIRPAFFTAVLGGRFYKSIRAHFRQAFALESGKVININGSVLRAD